MLKTSTVTKLRHVEELLKTAHEAMVDAIAADPDFGAFAMGEPRHKDVMLLVASLVDTNNAGRKLQNLIKKYD